MAKIILLNKPFNVLSQFSDKEGRNTLAEFISQPDVYPAGRLDYDSEGLLLLTDNGRLQHQISHPQHKLEKTYWVQVEGIPTAQQLAPLSAGITLNDGDCRPATVTAIAPPALWPRIPAVRFRKNKPTSWLQISISEGRNRQVRRMTAAIGFPTLRLVRIRIGQWSLEGLLPGQHRELQLHPAKSSTPSRKNTPQRRRRL